MRRGNLLVGALSVWSVTEQAVGDGLLNQNDWEPVQYEQDELVVRQHSVPRFGYSNVFVVPYSQNDWQVYYYGLVIVPCILLAVLLGYMISLCVQPCCRCAYRKQEQPRLYGFVFFVLLMIASVVCWSFSYAINDDIDDLFVGYFVTLDRTYSLVEGWRDSLVAVKFNAREVVSLFQGINANCPSEIASAMDPILSKVSTIEGKSETLLKEFPGILDTLEGLKDAPEPYDDTRQIVLIVFSSLMLGLTLWFFVATIIQFFNPKQRTGCQSIRAMFQRTSCFCIFSLGLFLMTLAFILAIVLQPVATAGADLCSPSPDQNLQRIAAKFIEEPELNTGPYPGQKCYPIDQNLNASDIDPFLGLLCYYQTCDGENLVQDVLAAVEIVIQEVGDINGTGVPACDTAFSNLQSYLNSTVRTTTFGIIDLFSCSRINTIYAAIVHKTFCNGIVRSCVSAWRDFFAGSLFLLLGLAVYQHFHLGHSRHHKFISKSGSSAYYQESFIPDNNIDSDQGNTNNNQVPYAQDISGQDLSGLSGSESGDLKHQSSDNEQPVSFDAQAKTTTNGENDSDEDSFSESDPNKRQHELVML